jgi:predicted TIM-barrel fold metal-dependent hydrolase
MKNFASLVFFVVAVACQQPAEKTEEPLPQIHDAHVHLMSPAMVEDWQAMGIPFSRSAANYTDLDTILANNGGATIDLIGMGYVYGNPDYYAGDDAYERLVAENDYLLAAAGKHPQNVRPFFAIDPLKTYALEELERCHSKAPDAGLKLHFSTSQVYLTEPVHLAKVKSVFEFAAQNRIPVLLHFDNWHPKFGRRDLGILADSILRIIPPMSLTIAHFGGSGGFSEKTKSFVSAYLDLRRAERLPGAHTFRLDISAVGLDKDSEGVDRLSAQEWSQLRTYLDSVGVENVAFGSDYPLYTTQQYVAVLRDKLGLSVEELERLVQKPE